MSEARPRKSLGQHFLHDRGIIDKIISRASEPQADEHFVEIGPGRGALTGPLLDTWHPAGCHRAGYATSRPRCPSRFDTEQADGAQRRCAQSSTFDRLGPGPLRLVGNLPYNISTPLLFHILASSELFSDIHVMLQKEVVQRMAAIARRARLRAAHGVAGGALSRGTAVRYSPRRLHTAAESRFERRSPRTGSRAPGRRSATPRAFDRRGQRGIRPAPQAAGQQPATSGLPGNS